MPRILRIINRFNLGGPTFNAAYLTRYLEPEFETMLIGGTRDASEDSSEFIVEKLGLEPVIIPEMKRSISFSDDRATYKKIKEIIREFKPDIVHTHASKAGAIGRLAAHKMKVPVIVHTFHGHVFHSYFGKPKTMMYKKIERYLAKRSHAIVAISPIQKRELTDEHNICPPEKMHVIPLGFDLSHFREDREVKRRRFRERYKVKDDEIVLSITGRLVPVKNHALFLEVLKKVLDGTEVPVKAFIVGDGELREELEAQATALQIPFADGPDENARLIFTSWLKNIDEVNAGSDIAVLTSLNEGTPVTLIEAQASSLPIVTTEVGGIRDIVLPDETAFLRPKDDADGLANDLLKLIHNPALRSQMSTSGWEHVKERFHYMRLCRDMSALYRQLLD